MGGVSKKPAPKPDPKVPAIKVPRRNQAKKVLTRGERNCNWIEKHCRIPDGKFVGRKVVLRPWQRHEICKIYDNPHGTRRGILSFGRKNGKTALVAFILLLHLCGPEAKYNSQLLSGAQSKEQAAVVFRLAAKCVRLSDTLEPVVHIIDSRYQMVCGEIGTVYKALAADAKTAYGLSPIFIVHDELGQVKGPRSEFYEALETAVSAHDNPLSIIISTQAPTDADLLSVLIDHALSEQDPRVTIGLYTAPMEDDPFDKSTIIKANPAFGDFQNAKEVLSMAQDAKDMPSREAEYRNLVLNQRVEATAPFVSHIVWGQNAEPPDAFGDTAVYGGLDLSEINDLTALVLIGKVHEKWSVHPTFWLPDRESLPARSRKDRVPYDLWEANGHLQALPGKAVEYEYVAQHLAVLAQRHNIKRIAFDRYNYRHLKPWLRKAGFNDADLEGDHAKFVEFGQGFVSMSPALRILEGELLNSRLKHGNHPVLGNNAHNAVVTKDPAGNRKLVKNKGNGRIDGMVSLAMAMATANAYEQQPEPEYQMLII